MTQDYLSVIDNVAFPSLIEHPEPRYLLASRKYLPDTAVPALHQSVIVANVKAMSFTTDIWPSEVSPMSLISPTIYWWIIMLLTAQCGKLNNAGPHKPAS